MNSFHIPLASDAMALTLAGIPSEAATGVIKNRAEVIGFNPDDFSGHSLRAGLATSAAQAGVAS